MLREVIIRDGDGSGSVDDVNEAVSAASQGAMVDPNMGRTEYRNGVTIGLLAVSTMGEWASHAPRLGRLTVTDGDAVDYDMAHVLDGNAWPIANFHFSPSPVNGLEAVHHQLSFQSNHHISCEYNP